MIIWKLGSSFLLLNEVILNFVKYLIYEICVRAVIGCKLGKFKTQFKNFIDQQVTNGLRRYKIQQFIFRMKNRHFLNI